MPPEIADSDAESDFEGKPIQAPEPVEDPTDALMDGAGDPLGHSTFPSVDFDQFLSPTQMISEGPQTQAEDFQPGTRSTENLINGILEGSIVTRRDSTDPSDDAQIQADTASLRGTKRSHTADGDCLRNSDPGRDKGSTSDKRPKSCESKSKLVAFQDDDLFRQRMDVQDEVSLAATSTSTSILGAVEQAQSNHTSMKGLAHTVRQRDRPRRVISLLQESINGPGHQMSTSRSSMGGYESINMDFRGSGQGLDIYTNPFDTINQTSLDGDHDTLQTKKWPNLPPAYDEKGGDAFHNDTTKLPTDGQDQRNSEQTAQTSPGRPISVDLCPLMHDAPDPSDLRSSKRRKTECETQQDDTHNAHPESQFFSGQLHSDAVVAAKSQPKKRERKSKNSRLSSRSSAPVFSGEDSNGLNTDDFAVGAPNERYVPCQTRSRRGTTESSQVSQTSDVPNAGKRKSKKSRHHIEEEAELAANDASKQSSPIKQLTGQLHLSDEAVVGIRNEDYKPRASRSRSKKIADEDHASTEPPVKDIPRLSLTPDKAPMPVKSAKKPGKSKVKRAKTSAAALLMKSEQMISDGEEDVVWMDTKPAPVNLELPPDISALKKETEQGIMSRVVEEAMPTEPVKSNHVSQSLDNKITVEIPSAPVQPPPQTLPEDSVPTEPKKRGHKHKKVRSPSNQVNETEISQPAGAARLPLTDKDVNTNMPRDLLQLAHPGEADQPSSTADLHPPEITPSPEKQIQRPPIHSPINLPGGSRKFIFRVGLSRRQNIPSLLRKVDKSKCRLHLGGTRKKEKENGNNEVGGKSDANIDAPTAVSHDYENDENGQARVQDRDEYGNLIEWDF